MQETNDTQGGTGNARGAGREEKKLLSKSLKALFFYFCIFSTGSEKVLSGARFLEVITTLKT